MSDIKPFKGIRPPKGLVRYICSRPYDVINSDEARNEAKGNEMSLYHIIKPEIDFTPGTDEHEEKVYLKANENYHKFLKNKWLIQDNEPYYYVYAQTMNGRTQYGLCVDASVDDYIHQNIKKHELTRKAKEEDRIKHVRSTNANIEPVFLTYPHNQKIDSIVTLIIQKTPEYDFVTDDGIGHHFWIIKDKDTINQITNIFSKEIPTMYIADGHHRTASAAMVGIEKRKEHPNYNGTEEFNYFLAVCFPDNQLTIIDYNRLIKDLNGLTNEFFFNRLAKYFEIKKIGSEIYKPQQLHNFSLYLDKTWYSLTAKPETYNENDPIGVLDVTISSNYILDKILDIKDLRTSNRIDFVGGIRGLGELKKRVDSGEMKMALALYPVSMEQLINIADSGNIMPPKTTWFEPKLRSGLIIHSLK